MYACTLLIGTIVLLAHFGESVFHENPFDAVRGCLQYDNVPAYDDVLRYFPTTLFRNMGWTQNSRYTRVGMVGLNDGHIRYGRSTFPYDDTVVEIVVGGWENTKSAGRLQTRRQDNTIVNVLLRDSATPQILSTSRPLMFRLEVFNNGLVQLTRDGELRPFFEFNNTQRTILMDYISFNKWDVDMIYFYDCPI